MVSSAILAGLFGLGSLTVTKIGTKSPVTARKIWIMYAAQCTPCLPILAMISVVWGFYSHSLYVALLALMIALVVVWVLMAWNIRREELRYGDWDSAVTKND